MTEQTTDAVQNNTNTAGDEGASTDKSSDDSNGNVEQNNTSADDATSTANAEEEKSIDDTNAADDADGEGGSDDDSKDDEGAPESYEEFNVPEGALVDDEVMEKFTGIGKELNIPQEGMQKLIDLQGDLVKVAAESQNTAAIEHFENMRNGWVEDVKSDKELGGVNMKETESYVAVAREKFASEAFETEVLDKLGVGDHPEMIRFMRAVGKATSNSRSFVEGEANNPEPSMEERWYGKK